jgi:quercetin dioxygenase-like cupin family protein
MITRLVGKPNQSIGFEAVYVTEGSMTYDILKEFEYNDGSCINTGKGCNSIELKSGDLLIIPRPVARQITDVKPGTKYVYLGDPWTDDDKPQEVS